MTRIDFFFNAPDKLTAAIKLARKAYGKKNRVLVYTRDAGQLDAFDRLLWTAPPTGFVPHCRTGHHLAPHTAVLLTCDAAFDTDAMPHHDVLLNLDSERPAQFSRYERLLEIVSRDDDEDRQRARARLKFYRERGYEINTVDLAALREKEPV